MQGCGKSGDELKVAITWNVGRGEGKEGEARVDSRWEEVDSVVQLEQGGKNLAALPPLCPWQASLVDHRTLLPTDSPSQPLAQCWVLPTNCHARH